MEEKDLKQFAVPIAILVLTIIAFFVIKPLFIPILVGLILAYILYPLFLKLNRRILSKKLSATIILVLMLFLILLPLMLIIYASTRQIFEVYILIKNLDLGSIIQNIAPSLLTNQIVAGEITSALSHLNAQFTQVILSFFNTTILNLPSIILGVVILLFTFFFGLVEGDNLRNYLSTIFPFPKEHAQRFYDKFNQVTNSFIYGNVVVGFVQGIVTGIGFFMFGVPNAFVLTIVTIFASVLPVIGPSIIWVPTVIYLFIKGNNVAGIQLLIYGLFLINWINVILTPRIISKKAEMNPAIALIGMIGGLYVFGFMGLILGPLILAYLILLIEIYRDKKAESILIKEVDLQKPPVNVK